jgi:hypothetical protein
MAFGVGLDIDNAAVLYRTTVSLWIFEVEARGAVGFALIEATSASGPDKLPARRSGAHEHLGGYKNINVNFQKSRSAEDAENAEARRPDPFVIYGTPLDTRARCGLDS